MSELDTPLVIDAGSKLVKAGSAGDDQPFALSPTVIGVPKQTKAMQGVESKDMYVGNEALTKQDLLHLKYPIVRGIVNDWHDMEAVWHHIFTAELRADPSMHPILLTESPQSPKAHREKTIEIMFERFGIPSIAVASTPILALFANGRTTGLGVESGDGVTHIMPVYNGHAIDKATLHMEIAGRDVSDCLGRELRKDGVQFQSSLEHGITDDIKETCCYLAEDFNLEQEKPLEECKIDYTLPDNRVITVGRARYLAPEAMFNPKKILGSDIAGIHEQIARSINASEVDIRTTLGVNIVLTGGNTMLACFPARLQKELQTVVDKSCKVYAPPERRYSAWIGGSILASVSSFQETAITKAEYDEEGSAVIRRKGTFSS